MLGGKIYIWSFWDLLEESELFIAAKSKRKNYAKVKVLMHQSYIGGSLWLVLWVISNNFSQCNKFS